jgi:hypothetical protein
VTRAQKIAAAWAALPVSELTDQVRLLVKARDAASRAVWTAVREDRVLAARVRGSLAGLKAEFRGHRDEAMWLVWINQVQQQLSVVADAPAATPVEPVAPVVVEQVTEPVLELTVERRDEPAPQPRAQVPTMLFQEPGLSTAH